MPLHSISAMQSQQKPQPQRHQPFIEYLIDKWDSHLCMLLGVLLMIFASYPSFLQQYFQYYVFLMITVVLIDTIKNFREHENIFWKLLALVSNGLVLASCLLILDFYYSMLPFSLSAMLPFTVDNVLFQRIGLLLLVENSLWAYVYDHF